MGEVILLQQRHDIGYRHLPFGRHQLPSLLRQGRVHGDSHVALALVQKPFQLSAYANTAHRDALRTPGIAVCASQDFRSAKHGVEIVHRLTLSHEYDVGQLVALRQRIYLVQDVGSRQVALPALLASLTKEAVHLAAYLTRYAQRATLDVRNEHRLDELRGWLPGISGNSCISCCTDREQVLHCPILTPLTVDGRHRSHSVLCLQQLTVLLRNVSHPVDVSHVLLIEPTSQLPTRKGRHTQHLGNAFQLCQRHAE